MKAVAQPGRDASKPSAQVLMHLLHCLRAANPPPAWESLCRGHPSQNPSPPAWGPSLGYADMCVWVEVYGSVAQTRPTFPAPEQTQRPKLCPAWRNLWKPWPQHLAGIGNCCSGLPEVLLPDPVGEGRDTIPVDCQPGEHIAFAAAAERLEERGKQQITLGHYPSQQTSNVIAQPHFMRGNKFVVL